MILRQLFLVGVAGDRRIQAAPTFFSFPTSLNTPATATTTGQAKGGRGPILRQSGRGHKKAGLPRRRGKRLREFETDRSIPSQRMWDLAPNRLRKRDR